MRLNAVLATQRALSSALEARHSVLTAKLETVRAALLAKGRLGSGETPKGASLADQTAFLAAVRARAGAAQRRMARTADATTEQRLEEAVDCELRRSLLSCPATGTLLRPRVAAHLQAAARARLAVDTTRRRCAAGGEAPGALLASAARSLRAEQAEEANAQAQAQQAAARRKEREARRVRPLSCQFAQHWELTAALFPAGVSGGSQGQPAAPQRDLGLGLHSRRKSSDGCARQRRRPSHAGPALRVKERESACESHYCSRSSGSRLAAPVSRMCMRG